MKTLVLSILLAFGVLITNGQIPSRSTLGVDLQGKLNYPFISENGGRAFLQVTITTADLGVRNERKPMNLAIVLDRSGSMGSEHKMEYVKQAFNTLVDQLQQNDILSIIVYDDVISVLRSAQRVGKDKAEIRHSIYDIFPRGSTNLGGGLSAGLHQVEKYSDLEYTNRVILLSDGLANIGITDPVKLYRTAQRYRNRSISITTMGVGLEYNENLMMGLAENGGGNYYFIERPHDLERIVRKELNSLSTVLAQNAVLAIRPGKNIHIINVIGYEYARNNNTIDIPVGDLYSNDHRDITIEVEIPSGQGSAVVASGTLRYKADRLSPHYPVFHTEVHYTPDLVEVEKKRDLKTQAKADIAVSTQKVENALKLMDEGNRKGAEQELSEAKSYLLQSPAASMSGAGGKLVREQISRTDSYKKMMNDTTDERKVKKSIQYNNYQVRKH